MKFFALLVVPLALFLVACGKGKSTETASSEFSTLDEKKAFLERYVSFRRAYDDLHFQISFIDGGGMVPGPTEWDIRVFAVVPVEELDLWIEGLGVGTQSEQNWITGIPQTPSDLSGFKW